MDEHISNAREELKRVDHLIYVSLKYTRTVDVLKNVINRLIAAFDFMIADLLRIREDNMDGAIPTAPAMKCEVLRGLYKDDEKIIALVDFYMLLRKLSRAEYKRINEFRRHVTMIADVEGKTVDVNIDIATEYYASAKDYLIYIKKMEEVDA